MKPGDWVLDVGANVGHYSHRLSDLVGPAGRIFAFEPVRETFELLTANVARFAHANVTLLNVTASDTARTVGMTAPVRSDDGLTNYYVGMSADVAGFLAGLGYSFMQADGSPNRTGQRLTPRAQLLQTST